MKLNISHPSNGSQKLIDIEDERKLRVFMDKRVCGVPRVLFPGGLGCRTGDGCESRPRLQFFFPPPSRTDES